MKEILLCDDEPDIIDALFQIIDLSLEDQVSITTATDSIDALILITEKRFDLILTDYKMPKLNGVELLHNMYSIESSLNKTTPVFIISGNSTDINADFISDKKIKLIPKPVDTVYLINIIKETLSI